VIKESRPEHRVSGSDIQARQVHGGAGDLAPRSCGQGGTKAGIELFQRQPAPREMLTVRGGGHVPVGIANAQVRPHLRVINFSCQRSGQPHPGCRCEAIVAARPVMRDYFPIYLDQL
jgi:hypothetical protein